MKTLARFLVITTLAVGLSGCLGGNAPDLGQATQATRSVDAHEVPADLMHCDAFYGTDWDIPDLLVGVKGYPEQVVLVQAGEMVCRGEMRQLTHRLRDVDLTTLMPLSGDLDSAGGGDGGDRSGESASAPVDDSNPLPATPLDGGSASAPVDDSNPLPAHTTIVDIPRELSDIFPD